MSKFIFFIWHIPGEKSKGEGKEDLSITQRLEWSIKDTQEFLWGYVEYINATVGNS